VPTRQPHRIERKGGIERVQAMGFGTNRQDPPCREETWARARLAGPTRSKGRGRGGWASLPFLFIPNFLIPFSFMFSFGFKFKHATNSNLNNPNKCIKQKKNLGSA
jgi:hypothetical protein